MDLTGTPLLIAVLAAAVLAPVGTLLLWSRVHGGSALRVAQRLGLVALCQVTAVLLTAVLLNNQFVFYESWSDLLGTDPTQLAAAEHDPLEGGRAAPRPSAAAPTAALPGTGRVRMETVHGSASGITSRIWVLLPADYDSPAAASRQYPVVMFLPGYPGTPTTWLHALSLQQVMDAEVGAGRVRPFIGVLPTMNVASPRDTECTDVPKGPQVATWLGTDVPAIVHAQTRSLPPGKGWGVTGYSTGGFCTAKLTLTHPQSFGAGAVLSGYYTTGTDATTGDLFGGSTQVRQANDPLWLVAHRPTPQSALLAVWSAEDPETAGPTKTFLKAAKPPLVVDEIRLSHGGHNTQVWSAVLPRVLQWLDRHLTHQDAG